jgi:protocatechuate 3,4-dioxygenase beta subunit
VNQDGSNAVSSAVTGPSGEYRFPFLKPGDYAITEEGAGLATSSAHLHLLVGQEQAVHLTLGLQSAQQSIEVEATQTLLQTENGNQVISYGQDYVKNTPVNGGNITRPRGLQRQ